MKTLFRALLPLTFLALATPAWAGLSPYDAEIIKNAYTTFRQVAHVAKTDGKPRGPEYVYLRETFRTLKNGEAAHLDNNRLVMARRSLEKAKKAAASGGDPALKSILQTLDQRLKASGN